MTDQVEGQMSLFDLDSSFSRMCREPSAATKEETSKSSSRRSSGSQNQTLPMFLYLIGEGGKSLDASWDTERTDVHFPLLTDYTMHSFGEQPYTMMREISYNKEPRNGVKESQLSQILQDSAHQKYYLSAKGCAGILRRSREKNKPLPQVLKTALENQISREKTKMKQVKFINLEYHPCDSRIKIAKDDICQTLNHRMGTGGNNVPLVLEIGYEE